MHVEDNGVCVDLALGSWCLFYASQPPFMRSTSLILIYEGLLHFGATHAIGGFIAHLLRVVTLWSLSLEYLWHTSLEHSIF
jgi:hypothetical protein